MAAVLAGGIIVLGTGSVVAATLPSWTSSAAGTPVAAGSPRVSAAPVKSPSSPAATPSAERKSPAGKSPAAIDSMSSRAAMPHATGTITYTVKAGDTLSGIAEWFSLHGYGALYAANIAVIGANPNLIIPGEHITISKGVLKLSGAHK
jgi:resuscitation-promoting factor RpfA